MPLGRYTPPEIWGAQLKMAGRLWGVMELQVWAHCWETAFVSRGLHATHNLPLCGEVDCW